MSDYISREAIIGKVEKHYCAPCKGQGGDLDGDWCRSCVINSVLEKVRGIPAADVVEVVHAKWDDNGRCTNCGGHAPYYSMASTYYASPYCFECGAKMDKEV